MIFGKFFDTFSDIWGIPDVLSGNSLVSPPLDDLDPQEKIRLLMKSFNKVFLIQQNLAKLGQTLFNLTPTEESSN